MDVRTKMRRWLAGAAVLAAVLALPVRPQAQTADFSPVVGAIGSLQQTVKQGVSEIKARLDALLYPSWEYKVFTANKLDTPDGRSQTGADYAALGRDGWELVAYTQDQTYVFKRRIK